MDTFLDIHLTSHNNRNISLTSLDTTEHHLTLHIFLHGWYQFGMIVRYVGSGTHIETRPGQPQFSLPCQVHSSAEGFGDAKDKLLALWGLEREDPALKSNMEPINPSEMGFPEHQNGDVRQLTWAQMCCTHTILGQWLWKMTFLLDCARPFGFHGENWNWLCALGNAYPEMWFIEICMLYASFSYLDQFCEILNCVLVTERGPSEPLLPASTWSEQYSGCRWRYAGTSESCSETSETSNIECRQYSLSIVE